MRAFLLPLHLKTNLKQFMSTNNQAPTFDLNLSKGIDKQEVTAALLHYNCLAYHDMESAANWLYEFSIRIKMLDDYQYYLEYCYSLPTFVNYAVDYFASIEEYDKCVELQNLIKDLVLADPCTILFED